MNAFVTALPALINLMAFTLLASAAVIIFAPRANTSAWLVTLAIVLLTLMFNANLMINHWLVPAWFEQGNDPRHLMSLTRTGLQIANFLFLAMMLSAVFAGRTHSSPATTGGRGSLLLAHAVLSLTLMPWLSPIVLVGSIATLATGRTHDQPDKTLCIAALVGSVLSLLLLIAATLMLVSHIVRPGMLF